MRDLILIGAWIYGMLLSHGPLFFLALFFPPYAWYVTVERIVLHFGLL